MTKLVHIFWSQGRDVAPDYAHANAAKWEAAGAEVRFWDTESAAKEFPFIAEHQHQCSHHAMRSDLCLAAAAHRYGGFICGTDIEPLNPGPFLALAELVPAFLVQFDREIYNGGSYFEAGHPFLEEVIRVQHASVHRFHETNVSEVTGPAMWMRVLSKRHWPVVQVPAAIAFSHVRNGVATPGGVGRERVWLDPGFAGGKSGGWYDDHLKKK